MASFPTGALISAGGNLLGGYLSNKAAKKQFKQQVKLYDKQYERSKHAIRNLAQDAKAAGIHPIAALGHNVGGQGVVPVGSQSSLGDAVGAAADRLGAGIDDWQARKDAETATRLDNELKRSQIAQSNALTSVYAAQSRSIISDVRSSDGLKVAGNNVALDPGWSGAQEFQDRYGEPGEWLASPFIAGADMIHNWHKGGKSSVRKQNRVWSKKAQKWWDNRPKRKGWN